MPPYPSESENSPVIGLSLCALAAHRPSDASEPIADLGHEVAVEDNRHLFIGAQIFPIGICELALDERVKLAREQAQARIAASVFLVEPLHQDHVGDAGDVPTPIAPLRLAAQRGVAHEDRLHVLGRACDDPAVAAENVHAHVSSPWSPAALCAGRRRERCESPAKGEARQAW